MSVTSAGLLVGGGGFDAVVEAGVVGEEVEADFAGGAVAVFGDVDDGKGQVVAVFAFFVVAGAAEEEDDVGVLFDGAGVAEVGEFGDGSVAEIRP